MLVVKGRVWVCTVSVFRRGVGSGAVVGWVFWQVEVEVGLKGVAVFQGGVGCGAEVDWTFWQVEVEVGLEGVR